MKNFNLEEDYGSLRAVTFDFDFTSENGKGIQVDFRSESDEAVLREIKIRSPDYIFLHD